MKKSIKFLTLIIALLMCLCLVFSACANESGNNLNPDGTDNTGDTGDDGGDEGFGGAAAAGVLVVYFSATNNTEKVAGYIAEITDGATFELVPQTPYTAEDLSYSNGNSRVSKERNDPSLQNVPLVKSTPYDWEDYGTVFVGYPIWWGSAAWPVNGFIKANDFSGKTVIPFCTSASSGIGNSDVRLKEMAGTGDWKAGKRFSASATKAEVEEWIESLDIDFGGAPSATLTYQKTGDGYTVTGDGGQAANIVIPAEHDGLPVVAIADSAFAYSKHTADISSVTIPDSVTEIAKNAFYARIDDLTTVNIGKDSKLQKIGNNAFSGCRALTSIYLPAGLNSLGDSVFNNCGSLDTIAVAAENTRYSGEGNCLIDLATGTLIRGSNQSKIPASVTKIGEAAFRYANKITELTVPVSVTCIEKYAIQNSSIEKIIYEGTGDGWEEVLKASHKYWNLGKNGVQTVCADSL